MTAEKNKSLREHMRTSGLTYRNAAFILDMSESTVYRLFRKDLTPAQVNEITFLCDFYRDNNKLLLELIKQAYAKRRKEVL